MLVVPSAGCVDPDAYRLDKNRQRRLATKRAACRLSGGGSCDEFCPQPHWEGCALWYIDLTLA